MSSLCRGRSFSERSCRFVVATVVPAFLLAACGTPAPLDEGPSATASDSTAISATTTAPTTTTPLITTAVDKLRVSCTGIDLGPYPFDPMRLEPYDGAVDELVGDEARVEWDSMFSAVEEWFVGERTEPGLALIKPAESDDAGRSRYGYAVFEQHVDGLRLASWCAGCVVEAVLDGYGIAELVLPIGEVHVPGSPVFSVLATERACAGGRPPEGREVLAVLNETSEQVDVVVLVGSPEGDQTCPSNPPFTVRIELDTPLGDRTLFDTGTYPGIQLRGPEGVDVTETTLTDTYGIDTTDTSAPGREGYRQAIEDFVACIRANGIQTGHRYASDNEISLDGSDVPDPENPTETLSAAQVQELVEATSCFDDLLARYDGVTVVYLNE